MTSSCDPFISQSQSFVLWPTMDTRLVSSFSRSLSIQNNKSIKTKKWNFLYIIVIFIIPKGIIVRILNKLSYGMYFWLNKLPIKTNWATDQKIAISLYKKHLGCYSKQPRDWAKPPRIFQFRDVPQGIKICNMDFAMLVH